MSKRVLILGATSAIASEVAKLHAARGDHLHLVARNEQKLAALAASLDCSRVTTQSADFTDLAANEAVIHDATERLGGLDTVLIAHGYLGQQLESEQTFAEAERIFSTNLLSVVSLLVPLANYLESQRAGTLAVITSVAGERGRPRNYTYGAAKGALNIYLQGLRSRLYTSGVKVVTLKLGPVDTPMTKDHAKHALFGKPSSVARSISSAIDRGAAEVFVPSFWSAIMPLVRNTPERVFQWLPFLSGR